MPKRSKRRERHTDDGDHAAAPARSFWSGTITFGLVSIPVDLFGAVRARQKSLKMVDKDGHALGRQYHCSVDGKKLSDSELVRGYQTESGEMVVITDEEFESFAPEMSRDIELRRFVPREQIPSIFFDRPYFLAPSGKSSKAYNLLAKTMQRADKVAIGSFVMRSHEYLVAILSENGVLRAETLRHADEIRSPETIGLPHKAKSPAKAISQFEHDIEKLSSDHLDLSELKDADAEALQLLAERKQDKGDDVIEQRELQDEEPTEGGGNVIDFMEVLKRSLSKKAVARTAEQSSETKNTASIVRHPKSSKRAKKSASVARRTKMSGHKRAKAAARTGKRSAAE